MLIGKKLLSIILYDVRKMKRIKMSNYEKIKDLLIKVSTKKQ